MVTPTHLPPSAQSRFANAPSYDAHRPSYPAEAVEKLLGALVVSGVHGATIVDLGAGTGKLTELLAAREEGYEIIAVEPHDGMRGELERKALRGVRVLEGRRGALGWREERWMRLLRRRFSTRETIEEVHRILRSGGGFGMIWNIEDYNAPESHKASSPWESKVHKLVWTFEDETPRYRHQKWREVFDNQLKWNPFTIHTAEPFFSLPLGEGSIPFTKWMSKEALWGRIHTLSQIAILDGEELERVKKIVMDALESDDVETNEKGEISLHGQTVFYWTSAIPSDPLKAGG